MDIPDMIKFGPHLLRISGYSIPTYLTPRNVHLALCVIVLNLLAVLQCHPGWNVDRKFCPFAGALSRELGTQNSIVSK